MTATALTDSLSDADEFGTDAGFDDAPAVSHAASETPAQPAAPRTAARGGAKSADAKGVQKKAAERAISVMLSLQDEPKDRIKKLAKMLGVEARNGDYDYANLTMQLMFMENSPGPLLDFLITVKKMTNVVQAVVETTLHMDSKKDARALWSLLGSLTGSSAALPSNNVKVAGEIVETLGKMTPETVTEMGELRALLKR